MGFVFLLQIVAPIFIIIAAGFFVRKFHVLTAEADRSLIGIVVILLAPALAFDSIIGNPAFALPANWILPPILGFASVAVAILAARIFAQLFQVPAGSRRRTFTFTTSLQNYGYIPIPLCQALFDRPTLGVLFAFYLGVELAFWTIALWQLTGRPDRSTWRRSLNPPLIAIPAALILNALGADHWMPDAVRTTLHMLGLCAVPVALILSGALIADYLNALALRAASRTVTASILVRIAIVPVLILAAAKFLPIDDALRSVLVLQAAMPAAILPIAITRLYNGDVPTALQVVLGTSLISLVTIPLWISFGLAWVR